MLDPTPAPRSQKAWFWICLTAVLGAAALEAASRPFWFDELATYYISGAPAAAEIFDALRGAADAQPPVLFFVTRWIRALFGDSELALRLQAVAGFGLLLWCLWKLVSRRAPAVYGLAAMLFASLTWGLRYAHEARPYALVMAFSALALLLWSLAADGRERRTGLLLGLAATLALLLSSHYYAALVLVPLGIGELVRSVRRRSIDWAVWAALVLPASVLALYLPFIQAVRSAYEKNFFSQAEIMDTWGFYFVLLQPAFFPSIAALAVAAFVGWKLDPAPAGDNPAERGSLYEPHLMFAILALALLPIAYVGLAMATTGAFVYRYALAALAGVTLLFIDVLHNQFGARTKALASFCAVLGAAFLGLRLAPAAASFASGGELKELRDELAAIESAAAADAAPVTVSAPQPYVQYAHYARPGLRARLEYWGDPELALEHLETNSAEYALRNLAPWAGLEVGTFAEADASSRRFYLAEIRGHKSDWMTEEIERRRGTGEELRKTESCTLWRIGAERAGMVGEAAPVGLARGDP